MKRRKFIGQTSAISLGSLLLNNLPLSVFAKSPLSIDFTCAEIQERILVLVNQQGANDTLNTVLPFQQYDIYANNRPSIKIPLASAIELDSSLPLNKQSYLHPSLAPLKALYDQGKMNIVHGVGYANGNRSHFKSDDLWNTAGDSTPANFAFNSGWAGELFDWRFPGLLGNTTPSTVMPDPPCIEFGVGNGSILFATANSQNASIFLTKDDASSYYSTLNGLGGQSPNSFPVSDYGTELQYIDDVKKLSNIYGLRLQNVFNAGSNANNSYPDSELANQLKTVARLIKGGCKSNVYMVHQYGYDTHGQQVVMGSPTIGTHANLLKDMAEAIKAFQTDLQALGFEDRVVTATFSEFGRTLDENTGRGTDHGEVGTMFIIGKGVQAGVTGQPIDLSPSKIYNRGLIDLQYDYRKVWTSILQDFMGHGNQGIAAARMQPFLASKAPVIAATHLVNPACYINQIVLPLRMLTFKAQLLRNGQVAIHWETANEKNVRTFEIAHSTDGVHWRLLGVVNAKNSVSGNNLYELLDAQPSSGENYYRLKQVDRDNQFEMYGPVRVFVSVNQAFSWQAYPNPARVQFHLSITVDKKQKADLYFYDLLGHLLFKQTIQLQSGFNVFHFSNAQMANFKGELIIQINTSAGVVDSIKQIIIE
jgi:uncharacterized protein (DUF1501 family)